MGRNLQTFKRNKLSFNGPPNEDKGIQKMKKRNREQRLENSVIKKGKNEEKQKNSKSRKF